MKKENEGITAAILTEEIFGKYNNHNFVIIIWTRRFRTLLFKCIIIMNNIIHPLWNVVILSEKKSLNNISYFYNFLK